MTVYEYKVVPAPRRGIKERGVKTTEDRFALALATSMNALGADGWEYLRCDSLPCEERVGFTGRTTVFQNMMVFRRVKPEASVQLLDASVTSRSPGLRADTAVPVNTAPLMSGNKDVEPVAGVAAIKDPVEPTKNDDPKVVAT